MSLELIARLMRGVSMPPIGAHGAARALRCVPELADALPQVDPGPADRPTTLPVACTPLLQASVERAVRAALDEALAGLPTPAPTELASRLQTDPVTQALRRLTTEGLAVSPGAGCMASLEYVRLCAHHLANPGPLLLERTQALAALPPPERGRVLSRVGLPLQARIAAVVHDVARSGLRPPALLSRLAASPLPFLFVRGALPDDLVVVAGAEAAPIPADRVAAAVQAFDLVATGLLDRLGSGRGTGEDQVFALRFCAPELIGLGLDVALGRLRREADAWTLLLPQLARWTDHAELVSAGVPPATATDLLRPEVGVGVAAAVEGALSAAAAWEVLAATLSVLSPASEVERRFLVPRGVPANGAVVAVAVGALSVAMAEPVALAAEVDLAVAGWGRSARGAVWCHAGEVALVAFGDALVAVRFALSLRGRPAVGLPIPGASVATGAVTGGSDGGTVRLGGEAVQTALRHLPHQAEGSVPRPLLHPLGLESGILVGDGVSLDRATVERLRGCELRPPARRPEGVEAWESPDGIVAVAAIPGIEGAFVASLHSEADWVALNDATERTAEPRAAARAPDSERGDPPSAAAKPTAPVATPAPPPTPPVAAPEPPPVRPTLPANAAAADHEIVRRPRARPPAEPPPESAAAAPSPPPPVPPKPAEEGFLSSFAVAAPAPSGADPFAGPAPAGDPFASAAPAPSAGGPDFGDVFGIPVGDAARPPTTAAPALLEGGFDIAEEPSGDPVSTSRARIDAPNEGFSLPVYEGTADPPSAVSAPSAPRSKKPPPMDFGFLLSGYAVYTERERVVFGRPYGTRLIDLHGFDTGGNLDRAYQMFVEAKIREGFIPQTELTGDLPRGVTVMPLDLDRMKAAWNAMT